MKQGPIHSCTCGHDHSHAHAPSAPHPPQPVPWSILRMSLASRLLAALAIAGGLWGMIALAMRAT
ncbi:MAG: hypothetical protein K2W78_14170 [Xanthobacteraceae bacterium]|nr:hypothetical protein [Xanthobacteraceae bacterium]